jgi:hypothetical protein
MYSTVGSNTNPLLAPLMTVFSRSYYTSWSIKAVREVGSNVALDMTNQHLAFCFNLPKRSTAVMLALVWEVHSPCLDCWACLSNRGFIVALILPRSQRF